MSNKAMFAANLKRTAGVSLAVLALLMAGSAVQAQPSDSTAASAAEVRFQQLEKEVRRLTGQIEEQNYQIRSLQEELKRVTGDMEVRFNDLQNGTGGGISGNPGMSDPNAAGSAYQSQYTPPADPQGMQEPIDAPETAPQTQPNSSFEYTPPSGGKPAGQLGTLSQSPTSGQLSPGDSESVEYEQAYAFIKSREFEQAESAFQAFIAKYPNSSYMANAKYWYGETFYVRGNYEKAARIFAESYQADTKGSKAAGNLLKLGMSLAGMGKKDDACVAFKQLQKDYASSDVPILKRADTEMKRIGCL